MYPNKIEEIESLQKKINGYRPLNEHETKELREYFRIGFTYSSNALEGNSLTETETKVILEDGLTIGGKTLKEHFEAVGHSQAYDYLNSLVQKKIITEQNILQLHKLFYYRIDSDNAGVYRNVQVFISGTEYVPPAPDKVPPLMQEFVKNMPEIEKQYHPVEYAARVHKTFVEIHPFIDGNGRIARLLMNLALMHHGYPITIIPPILRSDYIGTLKKAQEKPKSNAPFINFISCMVYESQKNYLRLLEALMA